MIRVAFEIAHCDGCFREALRCGLPHATAMERAQVSVCETGRYCDAPPIGCEGPRRWEPSRYRIEHYRCRTRTADFPTVEQAIVDYRRNQVSKIAEVTPMPARDRDQQRTQRRA